MKWKELNEKIVWKSNIPKNVTINPANLTIGINWNRNKRDYEKRIEFYPGMEVIVVNAKNNNIICAFNGSDEYWGSIRRVVKIVKSDDYVKLCVKT